MSDLNSVTLIGRLTRDAELKYTANGKAVSKFSLAVNKRRRVGDEWKEEANFFEIILWGQLGESLDQYLVKGKQVAVIGELTQERWEQDGQNRSKVVVTAATVQLLGGAANNDGGGSSRQTEQPRYGDGQPRNGHSSSATARPAADDGFDDDIPF